MAEMKPPERIDPKTPGDYLEVMTKVVFQSGISWKVVEAKWPGIREAFHGFDAAKVAAMDFPEVDRLAQDARVIRNRRKLDAVVDNARRLLELDAEPGGFRGFLRSHESFEDTVRALRKNFKFMGDVGCHYFLYVVGEEVPPRDCMGPGAPGPEEGAPRKG